MTAFRYKAVDRLGHVHRGDTEAHSEPEAFRKLAARGLTPIWIKPASRARLSLSARGIRQRDIAHFTYQLSVLISARIPISDGLVSLAAQEPNPKLKRVITDVATRIESGEHVAVALASHQDTFGAIYVNSVRAAERSGNMIRVLEHLSQMLERAHETAQQIRSALMYPMIVVTVLVSAVVFLVGFVVPKFARMFEARGADLPALTRVIMIIGESMQSWWWAYLAAITLAAVALRIAWKSPHSRRSIDAFLHKVPYLKRILVGLAVSRFTRVFGINLSSGLGLIESLNLAGSAAGRPLLERDVHVLVQQVVSGGRLTDGLAKCSYLTPFVTRMLSAGEQSGELPRMCDIVARHYERETAFLTKNLGTVIEPVLVVAIALIVLTVAMAIFLPMWNMVTLIG